MAICGDVTHSRVARSNIWGLKKLGAEVAVCGHIHESWGQTSTVGETEIVNLGPSGTFFDLA